MKNPFENPSSEKGYYLRANEEEMRVYVAQAILKAKQAIEEMGENPPDAFIMIWGSLDGKMVQIVGGHAPIVEALVLGLVEDIDSALEKEIE